MFHVLTVHWQDPRWIEPQLAYLKRFLPAPYKVYAFLNDIPEDYRERFHYASFEAIRSHAVKLNLLADMAILHANSDDDVLVFIDGDAFPVADLAAYSREALSRHPLAAVQRLENDGDIQPHPCFCLTTVGFWKSIRGDWKSGYKWANQRGESVTDVGGNLLGALRERKIEWLPILRSNKTDLHPVWFGVYGDVVYHHGAGFRTIESRRDYHRHARPWEWWLLRVLWNMPKRGPLRRFRDKWNFMLPIVRRRFIKQHRATAQKVFEAVEKDPEFFRMFQEPQERRKAEVPSELPSVYDAHLGD